jgi:D-sedoheptulose 7-phosphate isomerase
MKPGSSVLPASVALQFVEDLARIRARIAVTLSDGTALDLSSGLARTIALMEETSRRGNKLIFIGNGGSAAIAGHQAVDYWKNGGLPALAFNDASLLTCISNDLGYERVFAEPIKKFASQGDLLVAISSSGRSPNILAGVEAARARGCGVVTLSGFSKDNPLRLLGDVNFHVPSDSYGVVEITHLALLHAMLEEIILSKKPGNAPSK